VLAQVQFGQKVYWWVDYRAAVGGKQYYAPGIYTTTNNAPLLCTVGVVIIFYIDSH
jgi:hypothetical protein